MSREAWIILGSVVGAFWLYGIVWALMWRKAQGLYALMEKYWKKEIVWGKVAGRSIEFPRVFALARISDLEVRITTPVLGGSHWVDINALENPFVENPDVESKVATSLLEAQNYYRHQVVRCFIPLYWPSVFLKFPEDVMVYFDIDPRASRVRAFQAIWTALGAFGIVARLRGAL